MATVLGDIQIQSDLSIGTETALTLHEKCLAFTLIASTATVIWRSTTGVDTDSVVLAVGVSVRVCSPSLAGTPLMFISATGGIHIIEELRHVP